MISAIKLWAPRPITRPKIPALARRVPVFTPNADKIKRIATIAIKYLIKLVTSLIIVIPRLFLENNLENNNLINQFNINAIVTISIVLITAGILWNNISIVPFPVGLSLKNDC